MRFTQRILRFTDKGFWVAWIFKAPAQGFEAWQHGLRMKKITNQNKGLSGEMFTSEYYIGPPYYKTNVK